VWGSDVFEFPRKSIFHKLLFELNLKHSDKILSTSLAMKKELGLYTGAGIEVTPFGVDTTIFYPKEVKTKEEKRILYFGVIKSMEDKYGIKVIIDAIQILKRESPELAFKVLFIVNGSRINYYRQMIIDLNLNDIITFTGKISSENIPYYHNLLDIFLNVSNVNESFGVSVIEAMACEKPVIVTNALGLTEIVTHDTGIIIKMDNENELADAIKKLAEDSQLRSKLGKEARKHVMVYYELENCVELMTNIYRTVLDENF
jgi:glycosyltransferase involved in cell wall biosynthesis